ncbi:TPA: hypothetical protein EYN98_05960 [Candidatus Poribacteria bacterium]|nr:hypothetical protein [Candidatus Poribacteria bacterium]HIA65600.1 hypothetical protein [Candidatus Poribacteria bacterium]HIB99635.1 hypothetical protein [Candidatus Poribacteria bacterium]HIC16981.1 hypothetical protein [Candidatus Poribacteria bacterium]HIM11933.1 hypothetical protein [Candidatus Poribacteria bacterium]
MMRRQISRWLVIVSIPVFGMLLMIFRSSVADQASYLGLNDIKRGFKSGKCRSCHPAIWREWERSMHAKSWTDPVYQEAASAVTDRQKNCDPCHAPEPVLITDIGKMPKLRTDDQQSGVSCLTCHVDVNGGMHGPSMNIDAMFHANVAGEVHTKATELCATCHGQPKVPEHNQIISFKKSQASEEGKNCATCHMPQVKRMQSTLSYERISGRRHTWIGSRSGQMLEKAAELMIEKRGGKAIIGVKNKSGHMLPGDGLRTIILDVKISNPSGEIEYHQQIEHSMMLDSDQMDNRFQPDELRQFTFDLKPNYSIQAKLLYCLLPTIPENEWVTMAKITK